MMITIAMHCQPLQRAVAAPGTAGPRTSTAANLCTAVLACWLDAKPMLHGGAELGVLDWDQSEHEKLERAHKK
jgi:hypothetical protein